MVTNSISLVPKSIVRSVAAFLVPLLLLASLLTPLLVKTAMAHDFSTSFLTLTAHDDPTQLRWSWRFTQHDIEALTGKTDPTAALSVIPAWLSFADNCRPQPANSIVAGEFAGERTYTFSGTAACAYRPDLKFTVQHIYGPLPDHKVLR